MTEIRECVNIKHATPLMKFVISTIYVSPIDTARRRCHSVPMGDMEIYRGLGQNVARLRKAKELTQAEVAAEIGLTRASLANIETGRQKVLLHHVFMLANALGCVSILDLIPASFTFAGEDQPVNVHGSPLSEQQHAQVDRFFRTAGTR